jgi:hypothetical protein
MERTLWIALVMSALASSGCRDECDSSYCDGRVLHQCVPGRGIDYWHVEDCELEGDYCVEYEIDGGGAQCAVELEPRAACAPGQTDDFACDGRERVSCSHGFAVGTEDCGGDGLCEMEIQGCVARPGIDPICEQLPMPTSGISPGYCDGEVSLHCTEAWVTQIVDCGSKGMQCYELQPGVYPVCVASDTPDPRCTRPQGGVYGLCIGNTAVDCANDRFVRSTNCSGICENGFCH